MLQQPWHIALLRMIIAWFTQSSENLMGCPELCHLCNMQQANNKKNGMCVQCPATSANGRLQAFLLRELPTSIRIHHP